MERLGDGMGKSQNGKNDDQRETFALTSLNLQILKLFAILS